ncbi:hypothetical protein NWP96_01735 [Mycoplasmopsis cynos]|nr:hypothetical protein [Mycoplasmopsis cynos]
MKYRWKFRKVLYWWWFSLCRSKKINIITDDIINLKDIDINQVIKEKEALEKTILQSAKGDVDIEKLEIQLKKTLFKIDSYNILNKN